MWSVDVIEVQCSIVPKTQSAGESTDKSLRELRMDHE